TVIMKIDLVGPARRGLAMGLNEFAGYVAVSLSALLTGYLAASYGLRPAPFYPGIVFAMLGLLLSVFAVRDTHGHVRAEARQHGLSRLFRAAGSPLRATAAGLPPAATTVPCAIAAPAALPLVSGVAVAGVLCDPLPARSPRWRVVATDT